MSIRALNWAFDGDIPSSSCKFVLVALADFANEEWQSYPSIETLCKKTALDRKTVIACIGKLEEAGFLSDTGMRKGSTKQVKVLQILEQCRNWNCSVLSRKSPENGTAKQSRKRDTEPSVGNHQKESSETPPTPQGKTPCELFSEDEGRNLDPRHSGLAIMDCWNGQKELTPIRSISKKRHASFLARLKDPFFNDNWEEAIRKMGKSDFCTGKNDRGWKADFEFFLRPDSVLKIMEGKYDNRTNGHKASGIPEHSKWDFEIPNRKN